MAYITLAPTDVDAGSPVTETLMTQIKDNFDDHEARIGANESFGGDDIRTHFAIDTIDTAMLTTISGAGGTVTAPGTTGNHYVTLDSGGGGGGYAGLVAAPQKMRVLLDKPHSLVLEARLKMTTAQTSFVFGLQDQALTVATVVTDISDCIFISYDGSGGFNYYGAKASVSETGSSFGTATNTTVLKMIINCVSAASITIDVYEDNVLRHSATDETKMPTTTVLRPVIAGATGAGRPIVRVDYLRAYWTTEPLSTL